MACHWPGILPRQARHTIKPITFPGHLFKIALQCRCGLKCAPTQVEDARCHCKCTVGNKGEHRKLIDAYGIHLSTCPWGGWRICKHDRVNEQYGRFCQGAGNDVCWARVDKLVNALPSHAKDEGRARVHRIPDIVITDQLGNVTLILTRCLLHSPPIQRRSHWMLRRQLRKPKSTSTKSSMNVARLRTLVTQGWPGKWPPSCSKRMEQLAQP